MSSKPSSIKHLPRKLKMAVKKQNRDRREVGFSPAWKVKRGGV